jgi:tRNA threonylcarbamoyladenosine biosynthesis protein TsaE
MKPLTINSLQTINKTAKQFLEHIGEKKIFAFNGTMGAGKTTFIKAICRELGVKETVNSPTFSIINEYITDSGKSVYHFDCYRINSINEALDIGAEDYFYSGNFCFIEWAENILSILPTDTVNVDISEVENHKRKIVFSL